MLHPNKPNDEEKVEEPAKTERITEPLLPLSEIAETPTTIIPEPDTHPRLASRMWHSVVDPIMHPNKLDDKLLDENEIGEQPEKQPDSEKVKVFEDSIGLNVDPQIQKVNETLPEITQTQPENGENSAEIMNEVVTPVDVEHLAVPEVVQTRVLKEAGTRKKERRVKRRYSDSYLAKLLEEFAEEAQEKQEEKAEEPVTVSPGLLKRGVFGIGSIV